MQVHGGWGIVRSLFECSFADRLMTIGDATSCYSISTLYLILVTVGTIDTSKNHTHAFSVHVRPNTELMFVLAWHYRFTKAKNSLPRMDPLLPENVLAWLTARHLVQVHQFDIWL